MNCRSEGRYRQLKFGLGAFYRIIFGKEDESKWEAIVTALSLLRYLLA